MFNENTVKNDHVEIFAKIEGMDLELRFLWKEATEESYEQ